MKNLAVVLFILLVVVFWMSAHHTHDGDSHLPAPSTAQVVPATAPSHELPARLPQPREREAAQFAGPSTGLPAAAPYVPSEELVESQPGTPALSPDEQRAVYESMHSAQSNDEDDDDW